MTAPKAHQNKLLGDTAVPADRRVANAPSASYGAIVSAGNQGFSGGYPAPSAKPAPAAPVMQIRPMAPPPPPPPPPPPRANAIVGVAKPTAATANAIIAFRNISLSIQGLAPSTNPR